MGEYVVTPTQMQFNHRRAIICQYPLAREDIRSRIAAEIQNIRNPRVMERRRRLGRAHRAQIQGGPLPSRERRELMSVLHINAVADDWTLAGVEVSDTAALWKQILREFYFILEKIINGQMSPAVGNPIEWETYRSLNDFPNFAREWRA
ncbi:hypothetical protein QAD02_002933 [Eretmocerus hayati]|uniref:Uncharacterized protein n=1 Tax=Eretmocerus hayati TaxID=131215 RepID=A0ACC2NMY4_9HYME|nr:hypothetical protein QAD02_002933 [Eretmocerus hayati]